MASAIQTCTNGKPLETQSRTTCFTALTTKSFRSGSAEANLGALEILANNFVNVAFGKMCVSLARNSYAPPPTLAFFSASHRHVTVRPYNKIPLNRSTPCCLARPCAPARPWDLSSADKADGKQGDPSQRGTAAWSAAGGCTGRHRSPRVTGRRGAAGSPIIPRTVGKLGFGSSQVKSLLSMLLRPEAIQALENLGLWTFDSLRLSDWVHLHSGALLGFYNDPSFVGGPFSETRVLVGVEDCGSSMPSRTPTPAFCMRAQRDSRRRRDSGHHQAQQASAGGLVRAPR